MVHRSVMAIDLPLPFKVGDVLENTPTGQYLPRPIRVLSVDIQTETALVISIPRVQDPDSETKGELSEGKAMDDRGSAEAKQKSSKSNRMEDYTAAPRPEPLGVLAKECKAHRIYVHNTPHLQDIPDQLLLDAAESDNERTRLQRDFRMRDKRFDAVCRVLRHTDRPNELQSAAQALADPTLPARIRFAAKACGHATSTVYSWLHRYWALGSRKNALKPRYPRCGNPGQPKAQSNAHLGRKPRRFHQGKQPTAGFILDPGKGPDAHLEEGSDKQKLAWGYRLINHMVSIEDAYLITCGVFWSTHDVGADGKTVVTLLPKHLRPSIGQFKRWGKFLNQNRSVAEILLGVRKWRQRTEARGGAATDLVTAVGQLGVYDSTSSDTFLTSVRSRLKKLPPMTRMLIKDLRSDLIAGFYCGWLPVSPHTALLAVQNAASSKGSILKRFGFDYPEEIWPAILFRNFLVDHGEMKAQQITEAEEQFGFGIDCPPTFAGEKKGTIERQHKKDHKTLDEKVPGNTAGGKHTKRGEQHAAERALWNYYEYMRELIAHIIWHNTVEEVPNLAPFEFLIADPRIKPTRLNIFNWLRVRFSAEIPCNPEELRAFTLPDYEAVVRKNGVYLRRNIHGRSMIVPRLRYSSPELIATGLMSIAKQTGKVLEAKVKLLEEDLTRAWLITKAGMIPLQLTVRDTTFSSKVTLTDWLAICADLISEQDDGQEELDQKKFERAIRRQGTTENAKRELSHELSKLPKPPSKVSARANLRANLRDEMAALAAQDSAPTESEPKEASEQLANEPHIDDAAAAAMEAANAEESLQ